MTVIQHVIMACTSHMIYVHVIFLLLVYVPLDIASALQPSFPMGLTGPLYIQKPHVFHIL